MTILRASTIALLSTLLACGSGKSGADAAVDAGADAASNNACPTAYQRVTAATAGHELALAYQEHVPTPREKAVAAALWATLIRGTRDGQIDQALLERLAPLARGRRFQERTPRRFGPAQRPACPGQPAPTPARSSVTRFNARTIVSSA